ncbi:hypothetical protein [Mariniphaga sediminis]|uniref:hypothetical protein n=1 Tax=Mariniphaga sediminis TaxID=1628158 RepID=UPI003564A0D6
MINQKKYKIPLVYYKIFIIALAIELLSSCATFNPDLIHYNNEKGLYEYGATPENATLLRNSNNELISESNYDAFLRELEADENKYQNDKLIENANSIKFVDHEIATLYSGSIDAIHNNRFEKVPSQMDELLSLYPDALYFSDCSFLKAFALEKMGKPHEAKTAYWEYLNYSSGKFTERFRGYRDSDPQDSVWLRQRNYAKDYILGNEGKAYDKFFQPFIPQYYYNSLHPGYSMNPEDYTEKTEHMLMLVLGMDISDNAAFGVQYYRQLNKYFDINPRYFTSDGINEIGLAIPIKIYKSENNSFSFKISPFLNFSKIKELTLDGTTWEIDDNMFDYGVKASAGYYFAPKLSLGASYSYHRYNKNNKYLLDNQDIEIWYFNEYDVSFYYDLFKGFSLKSGIKAGDFVAGVYWSGWEISYNFNENGLVFRIDMF